MWIDTKMLKRPPGSLSKVEGDCQSVRVGRVGGYCSHEMECGLPQDECEDADSVMKLESRGSADGLNMGVEMMRKKNKQRWIPGFEIKEGYGSAN